MAHAPKIVPQMIGGLDPSRRRKDIYYLAGAWCSFVVAGIVAAIVLRVGIGTINASPWRVLLVAVLVVPATMFMYALLWEAISLFRWKSLCVLLLAPWPRLFLVVVVYGIPLALLTTRTLQFAAVLRNETRL